METAHILIAVRRYDGNIIKRRSDQHDQRIAALKIFGDLLCPSEPERLNLNLQAFLCSKLFYALFNLYGQYLAGIGGRK